MYVHTHMLPTLYADVVFHNTGLFSDTFQRRTYAASSILYFFLSIVPATGGAKLRLWCRARCTLACDHQLLLHYGGRLHACVRVFCACVCCMLVCARARVCARAHVCARACVCVRTCMGMFVCVRVFVRMIAYVCKR